MALRNFRDAEGNEWQVWDVRPPERPVNYLPQGAESGWLAFRSGDVMRRLRPIPSDWESASEAELQQWCERGTPARART